MRLRQFLSVLFVVAVVAVIYSPSTIGFSAPGGDGGTSPVDTSSSGTSMFLSYLHKSGYQVTVENDSQQLLASLRTGHRLVYLLLGADYPLPSSELQSIQSGYASGNLSALVAEGNSTNQRLLLPFGASSTGYAISDPTSTFSDPRVFTVPLSLASRNATGVIDIASPILLNPLSPLRPAASTSTSSYDANNSTPGPRTVVAAGVSSSGSRVVILTDSAPFTNFLFNYTQGSVDEKAFVAAMLSFVDPGKATPILLDATHYTAAEPPTFQVGLPIGPLAAYTIEQSLSGLNGYYAGFPSEVSGFLGGYGLHVSEGAASALVALMVLFSVYGAITRWFAPEKRGMDDQPLPKVERTVVAESRQRIDFLQTSRSKGAYVATLAQLYEVLDSIVLGEFGSGITSVDEGALAAKVGAEEALRAKRLFLTLSRFYAYATGELRFIFPPILRWRALTARTTHEAEVFLNLLGITIAGEDERPGKTVELLMRERARA